jgi:hypothetical protein
MKQVPSDHYAFASYENPERFTSYYYQMRAALQFAPTTLLEVGVGSKVFVELMRGHGIRTVTIDVDAHLRPSACGSVLQLPLQDGSVDVAAAFQILEHLPFEHLGTAVSELARVSRSGLVVSLPEFGNVGIVANLPFVRRLRFASRILLGWYPRHRFDGEHYWEINKRGYRLSRVKAAITGANLKMASTWINPYNPYHRFFVLKKINE